MITWKKASSEWATVLAEKAPEWPHCENVTFLLNGALQKFLLAQNDSILQLLLEVSADGLAGDFLDPLPQLLFFLRVILLSNLGGWRCQRGHRGKRENCMHAFIQSAWSPLLTRDLGKLTTLQLGYSSTWTKIINQSGKTETDLWLILCVL